MCLRSMMSWFGKVSVVMTTGIPSSFCAACQGDEVASGLLLVVDSVEQALLLIDDQQYGIVGADKL